MRLAFLMNRPGAATGTVPVTAPAGSQKSGDMLAGMEQTQAPRSRATGTTPTASQKSGDMLVGTEQTQAPRSTATGTTPTASQKSGEMLVGSESLRSPRGGAEAVGQKDLASQEQRAMAADEAAPRERRARASRGAAALSMKAMMDDKPVEAAPQAQEAAAPSEEEIRAKWPELAKQYSDKPRLASMLSSTTLVISGNDESKMVVFRVVNEAQKDWVESKLLHDLEGNFRRIIGSMKIYLRVEVLPDDSPQEKKIYMPSEQAEALMAENDEVKSLVKDFELDIK